MKTCTRYSHKSIVMITPKDSYALKYTIATSAACTRELNFGWQPWPTCNEINMFFGR